MVAESSAGPATPAQAAAPEVATDDDTATVDRTATDERTPQPSPTAGNGEDVVAPQSMPAPRAPGNEPPAVTPTRVPKRTNRDRTRAGVTAGGSFPGARGAGGDAHPRAVAVGALRHAAVDRITGPRAADGRGPCEPAQGRRRAAGARLRDRGGGPPRPDAAQR